MEVVQSADECVAHNGDKYDIKWLRTRCAYHGIFCPDKIESYDTLKKARKQFNLNSNKLDYIAKFFGLGGKLDTGGFQLWVDVLKGDKEALKKMVEYCDQDVLVLEKVFKKIYLYSEVNHHSGVAYGEAKWSCVKCGSTRIRSNGTRVTKAGGTRHRLRCKSCNAGWSVTQAVFKTFLAYQFDQKKKNEENNNTD